MESAGDGASTGVADAVQDPPEAVAETGADATRPTHPGWAIPAFRWVAVVAVLAVLAGGAFTGWLLYEQHQKEVAARQALDAAQRYVVALANIDSHALDDKFNDILDGSTGEFRDTYSKARPQLRHELENSQALSKGTIVEATVKSATPDRVVVLMFVDQSVSNIASPHPQIERSRIKMTMEKVDGRWLASKVQLL